MKKYPFTKFFYSFEKRVLVFRQLFLVVFFITILLSNFSCRFFGSDKDPNCNSIIPREIMVDLLHDIYLMEGYLLANINLQVEDSVDYYFAGVFNKHKISYTRFNEAMSCYLFNQEDMEFMHEKVLAMISEREERIERLRALPFADILESGFQEYPDCFLADVCFLL